MMMIPNGGNGNGTRFLPPNWEQAVEPRSNRFYYVDHTTKTTTWLNPLDRLTKPKSVNDCFDDQLPFGWERLVDPVVGVYYADHIEGKNQWDNPVDVWRKRLVLLNENHYSNSQHILQTEGQLSNGNNLNGNTTSASLTTTATMTTTPTAVTALPETIATGSNQEISSKASVSDAKGSATSLTNATPKQLLDTLDQIGSTSSNNSSKGFDASLLNIMENRFGRKASQSVEV